VTRAARTLLQVKALGNFFYRAAARFESRQRILRLLNRRPALGSNFWGHDPIMRALKLVAVATRSCDLTRLTELTGEPYGEHCKSIPNLEKARFEWRNAMAKTMKAAVVHQFRKPLSMEEMPVPEVVQDKILVKTEAPGVCHTDLHAADGDWPVKPN